MSRAAPKPAPTCVVHMHRPYLKFPYTCSKPVRVRPFVWRESPSVVLPWSSAPVRSVCVKYARCHVHLVLGTCADTFNRYGGRCAFHTETLAHTQTGGIIYGEAAASRMMKGFQPLSPCPCVRMSHRPNHKIVIEVSDVATLSTIAVWQTRAVF